METPDDFLWRHYRMHQRRRRLKRGIDLATWLLLGFIFAGLLIVLAVQHWS